MSNMNAKCGWISNNGINYFDSSSDRLSRIVSQMKNKNISPLCKGNVNWLNYKGPVFNKVNVNNPHDMHRDGFKEGTEEPAQRKVSGKVLGSPHFKINKVYFY